MVHSKTVCKKRPSLNSWCLRSRTWVGGCPLRANAGEMPGKAGAGPMLMKRSQKLMPKNCPPICCCMNSSGASQVGRPGAPRHIHPQHRLYGGVGLQAFLDQSGAGDVAPQLFYLPAVVGAATHGGVQAEAVDVFTQRLLKCFLAALGLAGGATSCCLSRSRFHAQTSNCCCRLHCRNAVRRHESFSDRCVYLAARALAKPRPARARPTSSSDAGSGTDPPVKLTSSNTILPAAPEAPEANKPVTLLPSAKKIVANSSPRKFGAIVSSTKAPFQPP